MSRDIYIARAAALQAATAIQKGGHFFCDQLPSMDVERFLTALDEETDGAVGVSLALVGYGASETDLRYRLDTLKLAVGHVTTDLHIAARWRNEPEAHSQIIALARGRHPGVSTLAHFPRGDTREFARGLLRWARTERASLASTPPQRSLLRVLEESSHLGPLVSLSGVAEFLATWHEVRGDDALGAPRRALPRLGILPDRNLLSDSSEIAERLLANFKLTQDIARTTGSRLDDVRKRVRRGSAEQRTRGLDVIERAERIRRNGDFDAYGRLDYDEAREVFRPSSRASRAVPPPDDPDESQGTGVRDGRAVTRDVFGYRVFGAISPVPRGRNGAGVRGSYGMTCCAVHGFVVLAGTGFCRWKGPRAECSGGPSAPAGGAAFWSARRRSSDVEQARRLRPARRRGGGERAGVAGGRGFPRVSVRGRGPRVEPGRRGGVVPAPLAVRRAAAGRGLRARWVRGRAASW